MRRIANIKVILNRGFLVLWAAAIFWFYLGNLINFHQNRIWGKILIPACFTHSSVNNKDFGSLLSSDHDSFAALFDVDFDALADIQIITTSPVVAELYLIDNPSDETPVRLLVITNNQLRGPPVAC